MKQTVRLGRVAGIPIGANWSALLAFLLVTEILGDGLLPAETPGHPAWSYWLVAVGVAILFLAGLLAHELAHAVVAKRYGVRTKQITLWLLGGVAELEGEPPTARAQLAIAVAGPGTSVGVGVVAGAGMFVAAVAGAPEPLVGGLGWLAAVNVLIAVFNLLPGAPLDGGRVVKAILWRRWGDQERAAIAAARSGRAVAALMFGAAMLQVLLLADVVGAIWFLMLGWFLSAAAGVEEQAVRRRGVLSGVRVADVMLPHPVLWPAYQSVSVLLARELEERQQIYPVVDFDARLLGVAGADALARLPHDWWDRRIDHVPRAIRPVVTAEPEESLAAVLERVPTGLFVVTDEGRIVGLVRPEDVVHTQRTLSLQRQLARVEVPAARAGVYDEAADRPPVPR